MSSPKQSFRRHLLQAAAATACTLGFANTALAQAPAWPTKPIRFVVGFAPGGVTDVMARATAQALGGRRADDPGRQIGDLILQWGMATCATAGNHRH
jgi:hypothetical protein